MPFATRSSELFRDQMLATRSREGGAGYPSRSTLGPNIIRDSAMTLRRQAPAAYLGQGPDLDQQMAAEVDRALLARQSGGEGQRAVGRQMSAAGSQERATENVQIMEEIEEAIRRRRNQSARGEAS